jgi:sialate O-acetylesterase
MKAILLILFLSFALSLSSKVKLPAILGDNMVLQQKSNVNLWGTASSLKIISIVVSWDKKKYSTISDKDGKWIISIRTFKAALPLVSNWAVP